MASSRPTLVVQLFGGLGNQMFQAAAGMALAQRNGAGLVFDLSRFRGKGLRAYALEPFALDAEIRLASPGIAATLTRRWRKLTGARAAHVPAWWHGSHYAEPHFHFDPGFEALPASALISGYFQSERYFAPVAGRIATAFALEPRMTPEILALGERLAGEDSVAIHVRRGDYAADPRALAVHGVLPDAYYERATAFVAARVERPRFIVFSDQPAAAAALAARLPNASAMTGARALDDLFLMSRARHHVIANSSFSWWSAWLDRRPGGLRIAPEAWFTPEALKTRRIDDLLPADWVRL